ncbi:MAG: adenine nucleotide alpha hydrolase [Deltaproteobacteria bacterium]|nr:adenine nucleotide alpha hydrolase [Deltaproteobacteria bacterium]
MTTAVLDASDAQGARRARLEALLRSWGRVGIAVSGGVDSVTLAALAWTLRGPLPDGLDVTLFHATSAAVPRAARDVLDAVAAARGWDVVFVDAGEVEDPAYAENPDNRCYFCKSHLFDAIRARFDGVVCTGANLDDLNDHRPGRRAAAERGVREPFVDVGYTKDDVRALARALELLAVADLPASPCLSSRVQTGVRIDAALLALIDDVERALRPLTPATLRCRVRAEHVVIEHDGLDEAAARVVVAPLLASARPVLGARADTLAFSGYRRGSAFLRVIG